jgi:sugar lactone lactonase YvrE
MSDFSSEPILSLSDVTHIGSGLQRPESVHVLSDGTLSVSRRGQGVNFISPRGTITARGPIPALTGGEELIPNGIAPQADGGYLIANIGEGGGIWHLSPQGDLSPHVMEVDGIHLAAANFVMSVPDGRTFITVSTVSRPRLAAYSDKVADGLVIVMDDAGARILADDICFANECRLTPDGTGLLVSETFARRVTRFDLGPDGLSNRKTFAQFGRGDFPDGIRFDAAGHLWVTCIVSNRLWRVAPDGSKALILEDCDSTWVDTVDTALAEDRMERDHFYQTGTSSLGNIASIAFSADGATAYLGSLCGTSILAIPTNLGDIA